MARIAPIAAAASLLAGLAAGTASAGDGPWQLRLRAIGVLPDEDVDVSAPVGGSASIDGSVAPELDITYFVTDRLAAELILATMRHHVRHEPTNLDLGHVWLLPPTLTLQYHPLPDDPRVRPYVGIGVNYTIFYGADAPGGLDVEYDDGFGYAFQIGADVPIGESGLLFNVDVKKVFLSTDLRVTPLAGTTRADVDIDPWIVGVGLGWRF